MILRPQRRFATHGTHIAAVLAMAILCLSLAYTTTAFVGRPALSAARSTVRIQADGGKSDDAVVPSAESAAAITDFMAKAHEEKVAAMARVEDKYKGQIAELQQKIAELESVNKQTTPTSGNSFAFPATNKDLTEKVQAYRAFISDYIVKAQEEKAEAVKAAESKLTAKYEAIIDGLKSAA
ncbi:unnamed protein product [Pseudo-nitzschia multistriata]|uniref:Uncharacterized protein n=1 Tax=Pseudo-nitzschia multistriata TaxID=183589 RepID=A0A448YUT6_9STRA|nr:unnamed protein product [Pseudo-nitzschia multistriata]